MTTPAADVPLSMLWLELTTACQMACTHCFNDSGPQGSHGQLTESDWCRVLDDAAGLEVPMVQLIGGEPTLHPHFERILTHAVELGLAVEVYSNLAHVKPSWWQLWACNDVRLATSYYSDRADEHERITRRRGSHARTRANIIAAVEHDVPLRASIISVLPQQRVEPARRELIALGVGRVELGRVRAVGRAAEPGRPEAAELCGRCGRGVAAVCSDGQLRPCVMARTMSAGDVREPSLAELLVGERWRNNLAQIPQLAGKACKPDSDGGDCAPAETEACKPKY